MTRGWLAGLVLALAGVGGVAVVRQPHPSATDKPTLVLLTSLPLLFGEQFTIERPRVVAMERIGQAYRIVPVALADRASLTGRNRLLMAHPRAQPAEALVELDAWVRGGGRVVLLADPSLTWDSVRPLGDPLRPPPDFADTGLLDHWGLRLGIGAAGEGSVRALDPRCVVSERGLMARCRVGRGDASIIADADFMMGDGGEAAHRLDLVMRELSRP